MGKWTKLVDNLPKLPPDDLAYQEKVDQVKAAYFYRETPTAESLAREYRRAREGDGPILSESETMELIQRLGCDGIEALLKQANIRVEALEQMLVESHDMDSPGWGTHGAKDNGLRMVTGHLVTVTYEPAPKVTDRDGFREWCLDEDRGGLKNSLMLPPATTIALAKRFLEAELPMPDGITVYARPKVTLYQPRKK